MSQANESSIAVSAHEQAPHEPNMLNPDLTLLVLTWVTFLLLLAVLYKFAWKPILSALDNREESIRKSVEEVERIKNELAKIEETRSTLIGQAELKSREIIDKSRKAAVEAALVIEQKAREETKILMENAQRQLKDEIKKAQSDLREESARIAVGLASKLIEENLDTEKNKKLIHQFMKDV